ncbi:MAG: flavodoxin domain-containing protein [Acidimicrobiia bacterium]
MLIAAASRMGSTMELAHAMGSRLRANGVTTDVTRAAEVGDVTRYDAVLLGSALYRTRWLPEAVELAVRCVSQSQQRPMWLFSSGPVGAKAGWRRRYGAGPDPLEMAMLFDLTGAREHRSFAGRLLPGRLTVGQRLLAGLIPGLAGDFCDWPAVSAWCDHVTGELGALHREDRKTRAAPSTSWDPLMQRSASKRSGSSPAAQATS